ncbi:hypothetical protein M409DRAFT_50853 [Zasmidium cellare ATCC 36951]|uniref:NB-ARC domain-containing protein n=1 Tax=Zasmidium cellare ATCC 36951 TaxID=1080233 RepID=A0A6A6CW36_ZASCE|nr:uncharacterized protein M409DRAFT_50853 [Zasmidium cellare ATCC 36951]KAF2171407.1 hypothetical protein M409DRAFT_50853 [Zasmidium cellare ATCC 36951]
MSPGVTTNAIIGRTIPDDRLDFIWVQAIDQYLKTIPREKLKQVKSINSEHSFLELSRKLKDRYATHEVTQLVQRVSPFLTRLHSFSEVIRTFINANPEIASLVWGSVFLVLEVRIAYPYPHSPCSTADRMAPTLSLLLVTPKTWNGSLQPSNCVIDTQPAFTTISQDLDLKSQLTASRKPWLSITTRIARIRDLISEVDQEALVTGAEVQEVRRNLQHHELLHQINVRASTLHDTLSVLNKSTMFLGQLPIHVMPLARNPTFFGRKEQLDRLETILQPSSKADELLVCTICGLGGAGKTQLALEYAYRNLDNYPVVFWINAETSLKLAESFSALAHQVGLVDDSVQNPNQLRDIVLRRLGSSSKRSDPGRSISWLLIFDNVGEWQTLEPYWPKAAFGSVIVTSRNPCLAWRLSTSSRQIHISSFSEKEGHRFLLSLAGQNPGLNLTEHDTGAAINISNALAHLPLTLDLVGSYVASAGISLTRFYETNPGLDRDFVFDEEAYNWTGNTYHTSLRTT